MLLGKIVTVAAALGLVLDTAAAGEAQEPPRQPAEVAQIISQCRGSTERFEVAGPGASDDAPALQATLDAAIDALRAGRTALAEVDLEPHATYRLGSQRRSNDAIAVRSTDPARPEIRCLVLNGNGATLLLDPRSRGIYIAGCTHCIFRDFTMRSARPLGVQGVLVASGEASPYLYADVDLSNGAAVGPQLDFASTGDRISHIPLTAVFRPYSPDSLPNRLGFRIGPGPPWHLPPYLRIDHARLLGGVAGEGPRIVRIFFDPAGRGATWAARELPWLTRVHAVVAFTGDYPADAGQVERIRAAAALGPASEFARRNPIFATREHFVGSPGAAIFAELNGGILFYDLTLSDLEGMGFFLRSNLGQVVIDRVRIVPLARGRLLSTSSDGIHMVNNRMGPVIRRSVVEDSTDDMINLSTEPYRLMAAEGREATVRNSIPSPVSPGDRFLVLDAAGLAVGTLTAARVTPTPPHRHGATDYRVVFTRPFSESEIDGGRAGVLIDLDMANAAPTIEDNQFIDGMRNGIIVRGGGNIRDNLFLNLGLSAIVHATAGKKLAPPDGKFGDTGALTITGNIVVDVLNGLLNEGKKLPVGGGSRVRSVSGNRVMGLMNFVVRRPDRSDGDDLSGQDNQVYLPDRDPRTRACDAACLAARFIHPPEQARLFHFTVLPNAALQAMKSAAAPVFTLSAAEARRIFGLTGR